MHTLSELRRYTMRGLDADVGVLDDMYFDDRDWMVRHLVLESRRWLGGHQVLIPPAAVRGTDEARRRLEIQLTRAQVEQGPAIETAKPVFLQHHADLYSYCGFPYHWAGSALRADALAGIGGGDPHLRSARAMIGYGVRALNGEAGEIGDFLIAVNRWAIRYAVIQPRHRGQGPHVLVSPEWIAGVSWEKQLIEVDLACEALQSAPLYDGSRPPDRAYEARLHEHYRRSRDIGNPAEVPVGEAGAGAQGQAGRQ
jgi:hypothetical protein